MFYLDQNPGEVVSKEMSRVKILDDRSNLVKEIIKEQYEDGSEYEGEKLNGKRHGRGIFHYSQGGLYDGE